MPLSGGGTLRWRMQRNAAKLVALIRSHALANWKLLHIRGGHSAQTSNAGDTEAAPHGASVQVQLKRRSSVLHSMFIGMPGASAGSNGKMNLRR
eukprot:5380387-Pleurochrysis_carterae.AAC.1